MKNPVSEASSFYSRAHIIIYIMHNIGTRVCVFVCMSDPSCLPSEITIFVYICIYDAYKARGLGRGRKKIVCFFVFHRPKLSNFSCFLSASPQCARKMPCIIMYVYCRAFATHGAVNLMDNRRWAIHG